MKVLSRYKWMLVSMMASLIVPLGLWYFSEKFLHREIVTEVYIFLMIICIAAFGFLGFVGGYYADKVRILRISDSLTDVYARHSMLDHLDKLVFNNLEYGETFCLVMFDIDCFHKVNEKYSRKVGDKTLSTLSSCIKKHTRKADVLGRYYGDKFILLCPRKENSECVELAGKVCKQFKKVTLKKFNFNEPQTVTAVVYEPSPGLQASTAELLLLVEQMREDGKVQGGDRVIVKGV